LCEGAWTGNTNQGYELSFTVSGNQVTNISATFDYDDYYAENCVGTNILETGNIAVDIMDNAFSFKTDELEVSGTFSASGLISGEWFYQNGVCGGAGAGTWEASCQSADDEDGDGVTADDGDCDDNDASVLPGAEEVCGDGVDQDCNGTETL
jgi:hypothetical protein